MWIKDFILRQLGIGSADNILDSICDNFDVEITSEDVKTAIKINYEEDLKNPTITAQDYLIRLMYSKIIDNAVKDFGLDRNKFDCFVQGNLSKLFYDGDQMFCSRDIEILKERKEEQ